MANPDILLAFRRGSGGKNQLNQRRQLIRLLSFVRPHFVKLAAGIVLLALAGLTKAWWA